MTRKNAITDKMAAQIKAMHDRGDKNQDIAAWFGINQGRVSEVCGKNAKAEYDHIAVELSDIPPPGPYDFGGGGIAQAYRAIVDIKKLWDEGSVNKARVRFDSLYSSLGRPSKIDSVSEWLGEILYDDRGVPK